MDEDLEPFVYLPPAERKDFERMKNYWMNAMIDVVALAPGSQLPPDAAQQRSST